MRWKGVPMMATDLKATDDELQRLRERHPAWHIWISQSQRFWATRKGRITPSNKRDPRWLMTIDADTPESLDDQLEEQRLLS